MISRPGLHRVAAATTSAVGPSITARPRRLRERPEMTPRRGSWPSWSTSPRQGHRPRLGDGMRDGGSARRQEGPVCVVVSRVRRTIAGLAMYATGIRWRRRPMVRSPWPSGRGPSSETRHAGWRRASACFNGPRGAAPLPRNGPSPCPGLGSAGSRRECLLERIKPSVTGWVLALDPIDQSWEPRWRPSHDRCRPRAWPAVQPRAEVRSPMNALDSESKAHWEGIYATRARRT